MSKQKQTLKSVTALALALAVLSSVSLSASLPALAANSTTSDQEISITVEDTINLLVEKINGKSYKAGDIAETNNAHNTITVKTDQDAHVKFVYKNKVLWEGDVTKDNPTIGEFDLPENVGLYDIAILAAGNKDHKGETGRANAKINYKAIIPSPIPGPTKPEDNSKNNTNNDNGNNSNNQQQPGQPSGNVSSDSNMKAPNSGAYIQIGGYAISMVSVSLVALLAGVLLFLVVNRNLKLQANSEAVNASETKK